MRENIDIYLDENFGKLYEKVEHGKAEIFRYEDENGIIENQFLKREIDIEIAGKKYYDLVTPYGYGGPFIEKLIGNKEELLRGFEKAFSEYCMKNNIVSEFVRFHPVVKNHEDFEEMYNAQYMRKVAITKLDEEDPVQNQFGKYCRKKIRQVLKKGVTYKVTKAPEHIDKFKEIYYDTMDRNNATDYYYFDDEYFNNILKYYRENLIFIEAFLEEKVIATEICFVANGVIYAHLAGTLHEYLDYSPAYILNYAIVTWGIENGYKIFFQGGGRTNSEDDSLYEFKKRFAGLYDGEFYIGKKIWNEDVYKKLCDLRNVDINEEFFPAYRK